MQVKPVKKGYLRIRAEWETLKEVADICGILPSAVHNWKTRGVPRKHRQKLVDASNGRIKSIRSLKN